LRSSTLKKTAQLKPKATALRRFEQRYGIAGGLREAEESTTLPDKYVVVATWFKEQMKTDEISIDGLR